MALGIVEQAGLTDRGRQRTANEDAFVVAPPYFAVADGMGGAKAGEVASQLATEAFEAGDEDVPPERRLEWIAREANRRIYELAASDESRRGMGTTLTAALVSGGEVSLGHVGDSRAYRLRQGKLEQLTRDHSLVAELERSGQISPEAAETHPQRSIITRALGPEAEVEVDTYTVAADEGDVFLLCSDGLTSMLADDEVAAILRGAETLDEAAEALVRAANQSGGKDNITVVLFRVGADDSAEAAPEETLAGEITAEEVQAAAAAPAPSSQAPGRRPQARPSVARPAPPPLATGDRGLGTPPRRRRRGRLVLSALVLLLVLGAVAGGLYAASRQVYFVGTNDAGLVTVYRGLPYELPLGIELYKAEYASGVPARAIPARRRERVLDHEWRSRDDATDLVRQLERGRLDTGARGR